MKPFGKSEGTSDKLEKSKVQQDLKEIMERRGSLKLTSGKGAGSERKGNLLRDFFSDEVDLTKKLLHIIQTDMDVPSFEGNEVSQILILRTILLCNYFTTIIIIIFCS